jgi:AraC family transcriptional regulator
MDPVKKAIWIIESRSDEDLTLADIAAASGVSRFHLTRAFGVATGRSVMRYLRGRRLTAAARSLTGGAADILDVALTAGYGSHEAFTRAFREQFGITPEMLRAQGNLNDLDLVEPIAMNEDLIVELQPPRYEDSPELLITGLGEHFRFETNQGIPNLWQRFVPQIDSIPDKVGNVTFGVCCNSDGTGCFEYVAGVQVSGFAPLADRFRRLRLPPQHHAVFTHSGHISDIRATIYTIWNVWLPNSGYEHVPVADFERYDQTRFDAKAGSGDVEIWVPIRR